MENSYFMLPPKWSENVILYEINVRNYSNEGSFLSILPHFPRLKQMGISAILLLPIFQIGKINRKGTSGSLFSISDYYEVNQELGTKEHFKSLVEEAHKFDIKVIIDIILSFTSCDHQWTTNPINNQFYIKDAQNMYVNPWEEANDVILLDLRNSKLQEEFMIIFNYWIKEFDIDGFRCDYSPTMPQDYIVKYKQQIPDNKDRVLFILQSDEHAFSLKGFDVVSGFQEMNWIHSFSLTVSPSKDFFNNLRNLINQFHFSYQGKCMKTIFIANYHDNKYFEEAVTPLLICLQMTFYGIPSIFNGQENGQIQEFKQFEQCPIKWISQNKYEQLISKLSLLRKNNQALWNSKLETRISELKNSSPNQVYSYLKSYGKQQVLVILNFSQETISECKIYTKFRWNERFRDILDNQELIIIQKSLLVKDLAPFGFKVYEQVQDQVSCFEVPDWSHNCTIYELNTRQFTEKGDFRSIVGHLPRLKSLGIDIIWLMPIHPIGIKGRKGSKGSPYSIQDFYDINPEYGTAADFEYLVKQIHNSGLKIIIDFVANHSSLDNQWTVTNKNYYILNKNQDFKNPNKGWSDVYQLNYNNPELRKEMINILLYWVKKFDIDGYRCDVSFMVPDEFWFQARTELQKAKKGIFMLAESEEFLSSMHGFDACYSYQEMAWIRNFQKGKNDLNLNSLRAMIDRYQDHYREKFFKMFYVTNHDENSHEGGEFAYIGKEAVPLFTVLAYTLPGIPLVYNGQENGVKQQLSFFEKDPIKWQKFNTCSSFIGKLLQLHHRNEAMWNGKYGGKLENLRNDRSWQVLSFQRQIKNSKVLVILNFSAQKIQVAVQSNASCHLKGTYKELFTEQIFEINDIYNLSLEPYDFLVLENII